MTFRGRLSGTKITLVKKYQSFPFEYKDMEEPLTPRLKERRLAMQLYLKHRNYTTVANKMGRSGKAGYVWVKRTIDRFNELGSLKDRPGRGGKRKLTPADETRLIKKVKGKPHASTRKTSKSFTTKKGERVGRETIRVTLKKHQLYPHRKQREPKLTQKQKEKRVTFAKNNHRRDIDVDVFWDEKEFELFGLPNRKNDVIWDEHGVEVRHGEVAHPSKFKVGCAISSRGATRLVPYEGTIDSEKYQSMISKVLPDIKKMYPKNDWCLVQDSAKPHVSKSTRAFLGSKGIRFIDPKEWPANSPDISPIENVYADQQERVYERNPKSIQELKKIVRSEWSKLTPEKCKIFVSALPNRLKEIERNGGEYVQ